MEKKFMGLIADILEVESEKISMETDFRADVPNWDSLMGFSVLVMLEEEFGVRLTVTEFLKCTNIKDIFDRISESQRKS